MARVAGITVERFYTGEAKSYTFDARKYGAMLHSLFAQNEMDFPLIPNETTKQAIKESMSKKKSKVYSSVDELMADCLK